MSSSEKHPKKVLFLALSGIGNLLMQLPTIEALKKAWPNSHLTVWVAPRGTKALLEHHPAVDAIIEASPQRSLLGHLHLAARLRRQRPDITIMLNPGQLIKGAAYMFASGAAERIAHQYPHLGNPTSHLLLTKSIPEKENLHDIEQNLRLLPLLDMDTTQDEHQPYRYTPLPEATHRAIELLQKINRQSSRPLLGLHPGSAGNFLWKRWPLTHFAHVAQTLINQHRAHILIFGGPDEKKIKKQLQKLIASKHVSIIATDLNTTAALLKHCHLVLANDSGLMHLAAAVGTPTFGIFGPTDEATTGPRGVHSHVIRALGTKPVYNTEANWNFGDSPHSTLTAVTPQQVLDAITPSLL